MKTITRFSSFLNSLNEEVVITSKRQNLIHFDEMKPTDFISWIRSIKSETNGILKNIKVDMKVDGLGARFGKDPNGRFFFEGSRTGPIFEPKAFSNYAKSKNSDEVVIKRSTHYDDIFDILQQSDFVKNLPNNTKVFCEIMYNPLAEMTETGIKFVSVAYDKNKLGSVMSIFPYNVVIASTGIAHPNEKEILDNLLKQSNSKIKIMSATLKMIPIDLNGIIDPISIIDSPEVLNILKSRKANDAQKKAEILLIINQVKNELADYIIDHPNIEGKFAISKEDNEIEGIVIHLPFGSYKITTQSFRIAHKKSLLHVSTDQHTPMKNIEIFLGRFQPLHNGHVKVIKKMTNPVIVLVKGQKSSTNILMNPFNEEYQIKLLKLVFPSIEISVSPNGYLPGIINYFRKQGKNVTKIYCGEDRAESYKSSIATANFKSPPEEQIETQVVVIDRSDGISATNVRNYIKQNDKENFQKNTPKEIWDEWDTLRAKLINSIQENFDINSTENIKDAEIEKPLNFDKNKKDKKIKSFQSFILNQSIAK